MMTGCTPPQHRFVAESELIAFRRGKQRLKEGRPEEALEAFLSVIDSRAKAPESHLESGLLYLNRFGEPILSIYHFEAYLRQDPNSDQADRVRQLIITAKKEFARSLPAAPFGDEVEKLDLKELLEKTRNENENLKGEVLRLREEIERQKTIVKARAQVQTSAAPTAAFAPKPATTTSSAPAPSTQSREYAVQEGDTLSSISKKFYGTANRWNDIFEANRDTMRSPASLQIGQKLRIP